MNTRRIPILLTAAALWPALAQAQALPADPAELASQGSDHFRIESELETWRAQHGANWRLVHDQETGWGRFLFGGSAAAAVINDRSRIFGTSQGWNLSINHVVMWQTAFTVVVPDLNGNGRPPPK